MGVKRAIIDIGSNTVRLVIYNGPPRAPVVLLNEKVTARLGRDVADTGKLSNKATRLALDALRRYATLLDLGQVTDVQTVATAAVRDAQNGQQFLREIERLGLSPQLLSGEDEARLSATGVLAAFPGAHGIAGDLGGGSLELARIADNFCHEGISLPLGSLRLAELRADGEAAFVAKVRAMLRQAKWPDVRGGNFYIVGGSWRALAIYAMQLNASPLDDPHDFELTAKEAAKICRALADDGPAFAVPRLSSARIESLPDAAALLGALLKVLRPDRIVFSSWGLREGLLHASLPLAERASDPMTASVAAFVKRYDVELEVAEAIVDWIGETIPGSQAVERELRLAATLLSLASMRIEPNVRAHESLDWALRKRWIAIDARGRAIVAFAMLANIGQTDLVEDLKEFLTGDELEWAVRWGLAVRVARKLTNCSMLALERSALRADEDSLTLALDDLTEPLFNASVVKNHARLAERLGLEPGQARLEPT
ncbi:MAG: Ppx/GppA family phosphatase [Novosphingobium sp.]|nr:Ppx/GppA family phosphatase [Novosphingobium sp.]